MSPARRPPTAPLLAAAAASLALGACRNRLEPLRVRAEPPRRAACAPAACRDSVALTYLGVGGFVLRHGDQALATAPSFTHRAAPAVVFGFTLRPDTALVDRMMRRVDTTGLRAILVGHAHYDHLLDVPPVARRWAPRATIYGSLTTKHILAGDAGLDPRRVVAIDSSAGAEARPGRWVYVPGGRFRFMPLRSSHAPNFLGVTIARGGQRAPRRSLPRSAWGWKMGTVYAYLVDVTAPGDSTRPIFRVLYQDAAVSARWSRLPELPAADRRPVDVAIVCVGNHNSSEAPDYPLPLLRNVRPGHVVLAHWENFFRSPESPAAVVPLADTRALTRRIEAGVGAENWSTLAPLATQRYVF